MDSTPSPVTPGKCERCLEFAIRKTFHGMPVCDRCYSALRKQRCEYCPDLRPGDTPNTGSRTVGGRPCCNSCNMRLARTNPATAAQAPPASPLQPSTAAAFSPLSDVEPVSQATVSPESPPRSLPSVEPSTPPARPASSSTTTSAVRRALPTTPDRGASLAEPSPPRQRPRVIGHGPDFPSNDSESALQKDTAPENSQRGVRRPLPETPPRPTDAPSPQRHRPRNDSDLDPPLEAPRRPVRHRQRPGHLRDFVVLDVPLTVVPPRHSQGPDTPRPPVLPIPPPSPRLPPQTQPPASPQPPGPGRTPSLPSPPPGPEHTPSPPSPPSPPPTFDVVVALQEMEAVIVRALAVPGQPCEVCSERWPGEEIVDGTQQCRRCHAAIANGKDTAYKFGSKNDMAVSSYETMPIDVREAFRSATEVERMLVARVQPVLSVHRLRGGAQLGYQGHVAAFMQDVAPIARTLPRLREDVQILIIRRSTERDGEVVTTDFRVRRVVVERMLTYLVAHNPFYKDVLIDNEALLALPEDGPLDGLQVVEGDDGDDVRGGHAGEDGDMDAAPPLHTFVPANTTAVSTEDSLLRRAMQPWPAQANDAVSEYGTAGYFSMAFPELFFDGKGDLTSPRGIKVTISEYAEHLLRQADRRFAQHPRLRFVLLNMHMRHTANNVGRAYVSHHADATVGRVRELIEAQGDPSRRNRQAHNRAAQATGTAVLRYGTALPGTAQFWFARRAELIDLIGYLGTPTIFFTLSSADYEWPELLALAKALGLEPRPGESQKAFRRRLLSDHPDLAAKAFFARVQAFFAVVAPRLGFVDWWSRIEFQARGSPHLHGVAWLRGAPNVDLLDMSKEEDRETVIRFAEGTLHLSARAFPEMAERVAQMGRHPSAATAEDVANSDPKVDLASLVNSLHQHTRCTPATCLRKQPNGELACRFGFPKSPQEVTAISTAANERGQSTPRLLLARAANRDERTNGYCPFLLRTFRANTDLQVVLNRHAVVTYIAKYASKAEKTSLKLSELVKSVVQVTAAERVDLPMHEPVDRAAAVTVARRILAKSFSEHDFSAQEVCWIVLGLPMWSCSRTFSVLRIDDDEMREVDLVVVRGNDETALATKATANEELVARYLARPAELEDWCLLDFAATITKGGRHRSLSQVVRLPYRPRERDEDGNITPAYAKWCLRLLRPHRTLNDLLLDHPTWTDAWMSAQQPRPSDRADNLDRDAAVDARQARGGRPMGDEDAPQSPTLQDDWMRLAGTRAGPLADLDLPVLPPVNGDFDWNAAVHMYDLSGMDTIRAAISSAPPAPRPRVDVTSLSDAQQLVVRIVADHAQRCFSTDDGCDPLRLVVTGTAGTGKSFALHGAVNAIEDAARRVSVQGTVVKVAAPTGVAAHGVFGETLHSLLQLPTDGELKELRGQRLLQLQQRLQGTWYLIVDEFSMVGGRMLANMDARLRQAFPDRQHLPFGGISVIVFGDLGQLPPVGDSKPYTASASIDAFAAYASLFAVVRLTVVMRQQGDAQAQFRELLGRLRDGCQTDSDIVSLCQRTLERLASVEAETFADVNVLRLFALKADLRRFNAQCLARNGHPIAAIRAQHNIPSAAKEDDDDKTGGLEAELFLAKDARIMLTVNLATSLGLVNGARGRVVDLIYTDGSPPALPLAVLVHFDGYTGPHVPGYPGVVPILPIERQWQNKKGQRCTRRQLPITLAWGVTIHKAQGLTDDRVIIDLGRSEFAPGLTFVATSRVRSFKGLAFTGLTAERLQQVRPTKMADRLREEQILGDMATDTRAAFEENGLDGVLALAGSIRPRIRVPVVPARRQRGAQAVGPQ